ncbi:MAG TPA: MFS transporter [Verrucomicrobiae bacterium]|jgi:MFS family permease
MENSSAPVGSSPGSPAVLTPAQERALLSKVNWRLIPLLFFCYVIAYIDRINVGFAKLKLQEALAVEPGKFESAFGLGAGIFFIGYFIFEVPSNLILHRVGARIWIARIMILWGIVSGAFMFLQGATMFYVMRFLLGAAEAGFFPGVLLYFTYWYPARERAKIIALFAIGGVAAGVIGSPINGLILDTMNGFAGLKGWQWLFLLEAIPAVIFGLVVLCVLPDRPGKTKWLSDREKAWIEQRVATDPAKAQSTERHSLAHAFTSGQVYLFCLIYFLLNIGSYGFEMWAPTIVKQLSQGSDKLVGWINAIPYFAAGVMMFIIGGSSDRTGERRLHIALSAIAAALGFAFAAFMKNPVFAMAGLVIAFAGLKCTIAPFWAAATALLSGTAAAGGIAFINSVGNLGGYVGPHVVGLIKDKTHGSNVAALLVLCGALLGMGLLALTIKTSSRQPETK